MEADANSTLCISSGAFGCPLAAMRVMFQITRSINLEISRSNEQDAAFAKLGCNRINDVLIEIPGNQRLQRFCARNSIRRDSSHNPTLSDEVVGRVRGIDLSQPFIVAWP